MNVQDIFLNDTVYQVYYHVSNGGGIYVCEAIIHEVLQNFPIPPDYFIRFEDLLPAYSFIDHVDAFIKKDTKTISIGMIINAQERVVEDVDEALFNNLIDNLLAIQRKYLDPHKTSDSYQISNAFKRIGNIINGNIKSLSDARDNPLDETLGRTLLQKKDNRPYKLYLNVLMGAWIELILLSERLKLPWLRNFALELTKLEYKNVANLFLQYQHNLTALDLNLCVGEIIQTVFGSLKMEPSANNSRFFSVLKFTPQISTPFCELASHQFRGGLKTKRKTALKIEDISKPILEALRNVRTLDNLGFSVLPKEKVFIGDYDDSLCHLSPNAYTNVLRFNDKCIANALLFLELATRETVKFSGVYCDVLVDNNID